MGAKPNTSRHYSLPPSPPLANSHSPLWGDIYYTRKDVFPFNVSSTPPIDCRRCGAMEKLCFHARGCLRECSCNRPREFTVSSRCHNLAIASITHESSWLSHPPLLIDNGAQRRYLWDGWRVEAVDVVIVEGVAPDMTWCYSVSPYDCLCLIVVFDLATPSLSSAALLDFLYEREATLSIFAQYVADVLDFVEVVPVLVLLDDDAVSCSE